MQRPDDGVEFHVRNASNFTRVRLDSKPVSGVPHTTSRAIGRSAQGREIAAHANFELAGPPPEGATLLIGGMHGDEKATVFLVEAFRKCFLAEPGLVPPCVALPLANPDGFEIGSRYNARGIDLNRNWEYDWRADSQEPPGPAPWSEPETRALRDFILALRPAKVVSLHWALSEIDADGPQSTPLAHAMWAALDEAERRPYRVRAHEPGRTRPDPTYEVCPGSLGQWCGYGLRYDGGRAPAMITLELPYDPAAASRPPLLPDGHLDFVHGAWARDPAAYLAAVEGPAHKMLLAACRFPAHGGSKT